MTRVIHTGDTHIGYRQYHSPARRDDFIEAFEQVIADAVDDGVDAVVHAGDLFHDRRPELPDLLGTLSALRTLADADVPFLAVVGNHESTRGGQWLDLFERLGLATRLGASPVTVDDTAFYGLDHVPRSRRDELDYQFDSHDATHAALVGHGLFTPFAHADWDTETVLSESNVAFDAMLLGDNHVPGSELVSGTWITYCGSTERVSASERDGRGYNIVTFGDGADGSGGNDGAVDVDSEDTDDDARDEADAGRVSIRRRSLDTRPFAFVSVTLSDGEGVERVYEQVRQHDLTDAVVIVDIDGAGDPVTPAAVEEFALEGGALVARVTDRREHDAESTVSVSFADPDDAVRERIGELGLSAAAGDVDETVRASKVADSNVRETVKTRVEDRLDDDLSAFESVPAEADGGDAVESDRTDADGAAVDEAADGDDGAHGDDGADGDGTVAAEPDEVAATAGGADGGGGADDAAPDAADDTNSDDTNSDSSAMDDSDVDDSNVGDSDADDSDAHGATEEPSDDASGAAADGQVSMEDFL